jgi:hypothetical protein
MTTMRRILFTFYGLVGIAALAAGGITTALNLAAGPAAVSVLLLSVIVGLVAVGLAGRILFVLENARNVRVRVRDD